MRGYVYPILEMASDHGTSAAAGCARERGGVRLLGVGCGQPDGSAEILLKAALRAAEDGGAEVELVRLEELTCRAGRTPGPTTSGGSGSSWSSADG